MKVLYIASSYPEPYDGATIYTDLAEALQEAGHNITVVVPAQTKRYRHISNKIERGICVLRVPVGNYYDVGLLEKGITSLKQPICLRKAIMSHLSHTTFDFVLYESQPITNAALISWIKKKYGYRTYLMLKDIFPQNGVDIGIIRAKGILYKYFKRQEKSLYKLSDYIGCMSPENIRYITTHYPWIDKNKIELFPNTKKLSNDIKPNGYPMRKIMHIDDDTCVFLFGGNMGKPQYVQLLCKVLSACKYDNKLYFILVGRGTERHKIERIIKTEKISNCCLINNMPRTEYEQILKECNVGLVILDPRFTIPNYPSRILSYMEYAKPVLAATDHASDIKNLILTANCGEWVWSGDVDNVIQTIKNMAISSNIYQQGLNGRSYIEKHFTINHSVAILENHFKPLSACKRGGER